MSKHTPTPWKYLPDQFNRQCDEGLAQGSIVNCEDEPWFIATVENAPHSEANADLIVRAVNSFADLVGALEKVRSYNVDIHAGRINFRPLDHIAVIDRALAKANGGDK